MPEAEDLSILELLRRSLDSSFEAESEAGNERSWAAWEALSALAKRPDDEVLELTRDLLRSRDSWYRSRGANILGQFQPDAKAKERFNVLSAAIDAESDDRVLTSLIYALSHLHDQRILPKYVTFAVHPSPEVREAVAKSIEPGWGTTAVAALCRLCSDEWADARDWATFQFRISTVDSSEIRQCLKLRLQDPEPRIRAEAICALAHRRDLSCLKQLVDDLKNPDALEDDSCHLEAATQLLGCNLDDERPAEDLRAELLRMYPMP